MHVSVFPKRVILSTPSTFWLRPYFFLYLLRLLRHIAVVALFLHDFWDKTPTILTTHAISFFFQTLLCCRWVQNTILPVRHSQCVFVGQNVWSCILQTAAFMQAKHGAGSFLFAGLYRGCCC